MNKNYISKKTYNIDGNDITTFKINNDTNGNPRYVVHFLSLNIDDYKNINSLYGFNKYRAKWFGGGVVFQSFDIEETLYYALNKVKEVEGKKLWKN